MFYFFNVNGVKCTDKTLTPGFACLGDFCHFIICRSANLVLSSELLKAELPAWKIWKADVSSCIRAHYALTKGLNSKR